MSLKFFTPMVAALLLVGGHQVYSRSIPQPPQDTLPENEEDRETDSLVLLADQAAAQEDKKLALIGEYQKLKASGETEAANAIRKQIVDMTAEEFKRLEGERRSQVAKLEERLKALREALDQREANSDKIIQRRVSDLLGEADELSWEFTVADNDPQPLEWLSPLAVDRDLTEFGLSEPKLPMSEPNAPNPDLALGYGLSLSQLNQYKKDIADREAMIENGNKRLHDFKKALEELADEIQGEKFGDKTLNEQYSKMLSEYREGAEKLREVEDSLQEARMRYDELELRLIPLRKEMDRIYGTGQQELPKLNPLNIPNTADPNAK